ncbi:RNA polymerase sigma factor [Dawidia soli]|uniref:Sigma-70 family RNA polymerase sigma factor n=1 Tax=Dawidia soli TaxID=2782352 RepID=A0AAP2GCB7_9BACT|nr:sigma-70 family RNA polymerase sigma factor [Dawidia soli]MBT1686134.1 sigma-70 family RNA polymerase sigma factor [Dawidia soli]
MDALNQPGNRNEPGFFVAKTPLAAEEQELWRLFRGGSRQALNVIFDCYARTLYSYGRNITPDQALISDCIQDVFVELWTKRGNLSESVVLLKFYLIKSLRRRILRRLSSDKLSLGEQHIPEEYDYTVEFTIEVDLIQEQFSQEVSQQLKSSLAALSPRQQEAIYLKFYENLGYDEIALVMQTNVKAVYNLVGKALISLRQVLRLPSR